MNMKVKWKLTSSHGLLQLSSDPTDNSAKEMWHDLEMHLNNVAPFDK